MLKVSEKYYNHILKPKITKLYQEFFRRVNEARKICLYNKQVNNDNAPNYYVKRSERNKNETKIIVSLKIIKLG